MREQARRRPGASRPFGLHRTGEEPRAEHHRDRDRSQDHCGPTGRPLAPAQGDPPEDRREDHADRDRDEREHPRLRCVAANPQAVEHRGEP
jgi:hypothetical protein